MTIDSCLKPGKLYILVSESPFSLFEHISEKTFDMWMVRNYIKLERDIDIVMFIKHIFSATQISTIFIYKNNFYQVTYNNNISNYILSSIFKELK